jgi:hypothetical protein
MERNMTQLEIYSKELPTKYATFKEAFNEILKMTPEQIMKCKVDPFIDNFLERVLNTNYTNRMIVPNNIFDEERMQECFNQMRKINENALKKKQEKYENMFRNLWIWLYYNPDKIPHDWPGWVINGGDNYDEFKFNPACIAVDMDCDTCPVKWKGGRKCFDANSEWNKYITTKNIKRKKMLAKRISQLPFIVPMSSLIKLQRCHEDMYSSLAYSAKLSGEYDGVFIK